MNQQLQNKQHQIYDLNTVISNVFEVSISPNDAIDNENINSTSNTNNYLLTYLSAGK